MSISRIKRLCSGASGKVFRVDDVVAKTGTDAGLLMEILVLQHLPRHENIAELVSYSIGRRVTVCTKYAGRDLHYWAGKIKDRDKAAFAGAVCPQLIAAVAHMYANGFTHCDIKPGNIVVDRPGSRATLIDFGAVHFSGNPNEHASLDYVPYIGTVEIIEPGAQMLWGVGAVLYTFMTGHSPKCVQRYDPNNPEDDTESASDYTDEAGKCTCIACVDWTQLPGEIYTTIRQLVYGERVLPPPHKTAAVAASDSPEVLLQDELDVAHENIRKTTTADTYDRAWYLYRTLAATTQPTANAWRICCHLAYALWYGVGYKLWRKKDRPASAEFRAVVDALHPRMFDPLPDSPTAYDE